MYNEKIRKPCYTIYSQRLAGYLMQHGFVLRNLIKKPHKKMNQFLFTDTSELRKELENYSKKGDVDD